MKKYTGAVLAIIAITFTACVSTKAPRGDSRVTAKGKFFELELRNHRPSLPGRFLLGLIDFSQLRKLPARSELVVIDQSGRLVFSRAFENNFRSMAPVDFKRIDDSHYSYFLTLPSPGIESPATLHFLTDEFVDSFPRPVPNDEAHLDMHDVARRENGNMIFVFYRRDARRAHLSQELQEWNLKGEVVFNWRTKGHLVSPPDVGSTEEPFQVNTIEIAKDSLLLSMRSESEIVKIAYPSGDVIWRLSFRDWKFENDEFGGFRFQHSVRLLPNGHLLLFDNGDGHDGRPARAAEYEIDERKKIARLVWEHRADKRNLPSLYGGSVQRLANGNTLIGWGLPQFENLNPTLPRTLATEVAPDGTTVRELVAPGPLGSYRVHFDAD